MKQQCQSCGTINPILNAFCVNCGNTLRVTTPTGPLVTSQPTPGFEKVMGAPKGNRVLIFALAGMVTALMVGLATLVIIILLSGPRPPVVNTPLAAVGTATPMTQTVAGTSVEAPGQTVNTEKPSGSNNPNTAGPTDTTFPPNTAAPTSTNTPAPTPTLTSIPTLTPTLTPIPTVTATPTATPQVISNANKIAFSQPDDNNHWDIYTINFDGTGLSKLIHRDQDVISPAFSPNSQQIAYVLDYESNRRQLRIVNIDGSGDRELTSADSKNEYPFWADDHTVLYISDRNYGRGSGKTDVFQLDVRNGNELIVVQLGGFPSRNGGLTTFSRFNGTYIEVFGMDGAGTRLLAGRNSDYDFGMVSPDGQSIAVSRNYAQLYLLDRNGNQVQLTPADQIAKNPVWSPDGRYLAYLIRGVNNNIWEINVIDINTKQTRRLFTNGKLKSYLAWGR